MYTYDIFDDMLNLRDVVNSFFTENAGRWRSREFPNVEVFEGQEELEIRALVPGVKSSEMEIYLIGDSLIIEGEKKDDYADNAYIRKERQFGKFKKSIKLPYRVDGNNIHADLTSGILSIKLQKSAEAKPKKIEIK